MLTNPDHCQEEKFPVEKQPEGKEIKTNSYKWFSKRTLTVAAASPINVKGTISFNFPLRFLKNRRSGKRDPIFLQAGTAC